MECRAGALVSRFWHRRFDHLGTLLCICGDESAELGGRAGKYHVAEVRDPRLHAGVGEARIGQVVLWFLNGTSVVGGGSPGSAASPWQIQGMNAD
jgi:hypothetical protein